MTLHQARKRFGQNFLQDQSVIHEIVAAIAPQKNDSLIEIGPGLAALTVPIAKKTDHLTVIEIDRDLVEKLKQNPLLTNKISIISQDATKVDFSSFKKNDLPLRIFGNLPYNISTPLIFHLLSFHEMISEMFFMLQKEVVERMVAQPNSKQFGKLSVMTQFFCETNFILHVPPKAFYPAPKVDSAVIQLIPREKTQLNCSKITLNKITSLAFSQRRKTLKNSLSTLLSEEDFKTLNIDSKIRAENLTVSQFCKIANYVDSYKKMVEN